MCLCSRKSILLPKVYENEFFCLEFKFKPRVQLPLTGAFDTHMYVRDKLVYWSDENKLDLYFALYNNVNFNKRKKMFEFLQNKLGLQIVIYPPL